MSDKMKKNQEEKQGDEMTRKEALKKIGYGALTAATLMAVLSSPAKAASTSAAPDSPSTPWTPGWN